jgi:hypothetical protein
MLQVKRAPPVITWSPASIGYGTPLGAGQLDATENVAGTLAYTPGAGTILTPGVQQLSAVFTPSDSIDYATVTVHTKLTVMKATPVITWANPAPITKGTPLSATQLDATANVPGTFTYNPPAGTS